QSLHTILAQQAVGQCPAFDYQLVVGLCETGKYFCCRDRISADAIHQRTGQLGGNFLERSSCQGTANQRILENTQIHARLTRCFAQYGYRGDVQTTVLRDNDRLGLCDFRADFLDDYRFLLTIETHGLNTPSNDAWEGP